VNLVTGGIQALQARILQQARSAPDPDAVPLVLAQQICGSVAAPLARELAQSVAGFSLRSGRLEIDDAGADPAAGSRRLQDAARWLLQAGHVPHWRDERLEVRARPDGPVLGCVDRCAVRVLGITTQSVRLNGWCHDGRLLVARRAAHKRIDPGLWDNLAGGLVTAGEDLPTALARETFEEAGLRTVELAVRRGGSIPVRRPIFDGVLSEVVHVFDGALPESTRPVNQDGEVERFESWPVPAVLAAIENGEFAIEAALATLDSLIRNA
jgi:8-oxo-dGTP pyrophosphatase MutT (NUDIX family)